MSSNQTPTPQDPGSFRRKSLVVNSGHRYSYIDQATSNGPVVLFLHGFPDLAYGWRYQICDLISRGYRTIAPDLLGYGGSSKPTDVNAYSKLNSCKALCEILEHENVQKVIVVGHDWGSGLASRFVQYFPEKVICWVTICVPPSRPGQRGQPPPDLERTIKQNFPHLGYMLYFVSPEFSDEINRYRKTLLLLLYLHTDRGLESRIQEKFASLKSRSFVGENSLKRQIKELGDQFEKIEVEDSEIKYFLAEFEKGGLLGPLSWYKTREIDHSDEQAASLPTSYPADIPCLYLGASDDPAFPPQLFTEKSKAKLFPGANLTTHVIRGGNHFMHQDPIYRDQVTEEIRKWIDSQVFPPPNRPSRL